LILPESNPKRFGTTIGTVFRSTVPNNGYTCLIDPKVIIHIKRASSFEEHVQIASTNFLLLLADYDEPLAASTGITNHAYPEGGGSSHPFS